MNRISRLLGYVEIKTKITSIFTFLMTIVYLYSSGMNIDPLRTLVFFFGMFLFDLTATTINNYFDTKKNHQTLQFQRGTAKFITVLLFVLSLALGLYLVFLTDLVVLVLGGLCFFFGVLYSYGPVPISHGPYGEIISGFFYGFLIPVILVYINTPPGELFAYAFAEGRLWVDIGIMPVLALVLLAVVPFCLTANIMLANNICDVEHDVKVGRYTLPYYIKKHSLHLFSAFYYLAYLSVIVMVILRFVSPLSLILLATLIPVQRNINLFYKKQVKEETFVVSIKNFLLIIIVHTVLILLGSLLPGFGPI